MKRCENESIYYVNKTNRITRKERENEWEKRQKKRRAEREREREQSIHKIQRCSTLSTFLIYFGFIYLISDKCTLNASKWWVNWVHVNLSYCLASYICKPYNMYIYFVCLICRCRFLYSFSFGTIFLHNYTVSCRSRGTFFVWPLLLVVFFFLSISFLLQIFLSFVFPLCTVVSFACAPLHLHLYRTCLLFER